MLESCGGARDSRIWRPRLFRSGTARCNRRASMRTRSAAAGRSRVRRNRFITITGAFGAFGYGWLAPMWTKFGLPGLPFDVSVSAAQVQTCPRTARSTSEPEKNYRRGVGLAAGAGPAGGAPRHRFRISGILSGPGPRQRFGVGGVRPPEWRRLSEPDHFFFVWAIARRHLRACNRRIDVLPWRRRFRAFVDQHVLSANTLSERAFPRPSRTRIVCVRCPHRRSAPGRCRRLATLTAKAIDACGSLEFCNRHGA